MVRPEPTTTTATLLDEVGVEAVEVEALEEEALEEEALEEEALEEEALDAEAGAMTDAHLASLEHFRIKTR